MDHYGVDTFLGSAGLCVHRDFRGLGVARLLLEARTHVAKLYDISVTASVFTGVGSQTAAERSGFEVILQRPYREWNNHIYTIKKAKCIKIMGKRL